MQKTKIQWVQNADGTPGRTWNPIRGCSRTSPGCVNCYAEEMAHRFSGPGGPYEGLTHLVGNSPQWTGEILHVEDHLDDPLRWTTPCTVFVNSMSDFFHDRVAADYRDRMTAVMALARKHTFQVLTKRHQNLTRYLEDPKTPFRVLLQVKQILDRLPKMRSQTEIDEVCRWPLANVWWGVSVENQHYADERVAWLQSAPAAVRFLSIEPQLGPVTLPSLEGIHWVIVGGESGTQARPFDPLWARALLWQCRQAGVACFVKQLGSAPVALQLNAFKGDNWSEWPIDLCVRQFPDSVSRPLPPDTDSAPTTKESSCSAGVQSS